jgi:hypothetical protein
MPRERRICNSWGGLVVQLSYLENRIFTLVLAAVAFPSSSSAG